MSTGNASEKLNEHIERAIDLLGSLTAVGNQLGLSQPRMSRIRKGKEHMPMMAAVRLADLTDADRFNVIVCSEMATAKDEDEYDFWYGINEEMESEEFQENYQLGKTLRQHARAASIALAFAFVTSIMTPTPSEAKQTTTTPAFGGQYSIHLSYGRLGG